MDVSRAAETWDPQPGSVDAIESMTSQYRKNPKAENVFAPSDYTTIHKGEVFAPGELEDVSNNAISPDPSQLFHDSRHVL